MADVMRVRRPLRRLLPVTLLATLAVTGLPAPAPGPNLPEVEVETLTVIAEPARPGRLERAETPFPAQVVGFTWEGSPTGAVEVRTRVESGWGPWYDVHANPDEAPDAGSAEDRGRTSAGPLWLGATTSDVEVRVEEGTLTDLRMTAIRSIEPADGGWSIPSATAQPAAPYIIPRSSWGAAGWSYGNDGCSGGPAYATPRYAVVHHTVTGNTYGINEADDALRGIQAFHTVTNGWCDIAYNFLVDRFGRVHEGRAGGADKGVIGGHSKGFNTGSFGVALLGDQNLAGVPSASRTALRTLLAWKFGLHGIDGRGTLQKTSGGSTKYAAGVVVTLPTVIGHRDVSLTSCPGNLAYPLLPGLRVETQYLVMSSVPYPLPNWDSDDDGAGLLTLDAWGGIHPAGAQGAIAPTAFWPGWSIARGIVADRADGGYTVDGWGGLHQFGTAGAIAPSAYWRGWDIVRGIASTGVGRGWVLDGWGGLHGYGSAPAYAPGAYWRGWDIARGVAALPSGTGGYVLDGFGGVHAFGSAPRVASSAYWRGWDIARAVATRPDGRGGYVLDGYGGVHPFGGAPAIAHTTLGRNAARGLLLVENGDAGWVVDADGKLWPVGTAASRTPSLTWTGLGIGRGAAVVPG